MLSGIRINVPLSWRLVKGSAKSTWRSTIALKYGNLYQWRYWWVTFCLFICYNHDLLLAYTCAWAQPHTIAHEWSMYVVRSLVCWCSLALSVWRHPISFVCIVLSTSMHNRDGHPYHSSFWSTGPNLQTISAKLQLSESMVCISTFCCWQGVCVCVKVLQAKN